MSHRIMAIYENGVLRPLSPLELAEAVRDRQVELLLRCHRDLVRQAD